MAKQARTAIAESDAVVFIVDGRSGLTPQDATIAALLRKSGRPIVLAVNKAEGLDPGAPPPNSTNWRSERHYRSPPRTAKTCAT